MGNPEITLEKDGNDIVVYVGKRRVYKGELRHWDALINLLDLEGFDLERPLLINANDNLLVIENGIVTGIF